MQSLGSSTCAIILATFTAIYWLFLLIIMNGRCRISLLHYMMNNYLCSQLFNCITVSCCTRTKRSTRKQKICCQIMCMMQCSSMRFDDKYFKNQDNEHESARKHTCSVSYIRAHRHGVRSELYLRQPNRKWKAEN